MGAARFTRILSHSSRLLGGRSAPRLRQPTGTVEPLRRAQGVSPLVASVCSDFPKWTDFPGLLPSDSSGNCHPASRPLPACRSTYNILPVFHLDAQLPHPLSSSCLKARLSFPLSSSCLKARSYLLFTREGREETLRGAEYVILALGARPVGNLSTAIKDKVPEVHVIGDASQARRILEATAEAASIARII